MTTKPESNINEQNKAAVFELLRSGKTANIPHFGDKQTRELLLFLEPASIEELMVVLCLDRPGIFDFGIKYLSEFAACKKHPEEIKYLHPVLEKHLKCTYGFLFFKEQMEAVIADCAGISNNIATEIRKALGKKNAEKTEEYFSVFYQGCRNNKAFAEGCRKAASPDYETIYALWRFLLENVSRLQSRDAIELMAKESYDAALDRINFSN